MFNLFHLKATNFIAGASTANFWTSVQNFTRDTSKNLTLVAWGIFVVAVVAAGITFSFGRNGSEFAKSWLGKIIIGVIIVAFATAIISTFASAGGANATF